MKKIILATTDPNVSAREKRHDRLAREIAREGIVLLKNDGMLPLKHKKIALYGSGARRTVAGGTGSGATHPRHVVGIEEGLLHAGAEIVTKDWLDRYDAHYEEQRRLWKARIEEKVEGVTDLFRILGVISHDRFVYPTGIPVEERDVSSQTDCAVYVIARQAGEGADRKDVKADYRLDDLEYANLKLLSERYKQVCVIVNVGGFIDLSFLDTLNISALIYFAQCGQSGGDALADLLFGKVSPSGKLTATWAYDLNDVPSTKEFSENGDPKVQNYREGIYVGYRYFDTFGIKPRYAFGYGLSYTRFSWKGCACVVGTRVVVNCRVKNLGRYAGKEVLQLYAALPLADAEQKRLVAFGKTEVIGAGGEEKLTLSFPVGDLSWYDEARAAYVLAAGDHVLLLGNSSETAVPVAVLRINSEKIVEQCRNVCPRAEPFRELIPPVKQYIAHHDVPVLEFNSSVLTTVTHDYAPLPVAVEKKYRDVLETFSEEELATLLVGGGASVSEGERLVNVMGASGTTTSALYETHGIPNIILSDGPAGLNVTPQVVEMADGSLKTTAPYPQYDFGIFGKIMRSRMVVRPEDGICHYQYATTWPAGVVRAQTWNTGLVEQMGDAIGTEMEELGVTVWLAPGMNITRNTLCGRTFEYCSEDPVLSGEIAAATVLGVQKHRGKGVSVKHFACNNSEFERTYSSSNLSERALREIYLKGFEIAVKKSDPMTVMASYNKINGVYNTNNYDLLVNVLRCEWGYRNVVISDWDAVADDRGDLLKTCAAQCDLVMPGSQRQAERLAAALKEGTVNRDDALRCAQRLLGLIVQNTVCPMLF